MQRTIDETGRRRTLQQKFNEKNNITPTTIISPVRNTIHQYLQEAGYEFDNQDHKKYQMAEEELFFGSIEELHKEIAKLAKQMQKAAAELAFEEAADLRDKIQALRKLEIEIG